MITEFYKNRAQPSGYGSDCKECNRKNARANFSKNKKTRLAQMKVYRNQNVDAIKNRKLVYSYGITLEEKLQILKKQKNKCAICGILAKNSVRGLHVDHCHKTNKVRGLLCMECNTGLGKLKDSIKILNKAITYLKGQ